MAKKKLEVGAKAPSFSLEDQNGETTKLADHKGSWVVVYFYPKDDTPGCTKEACEFTHALGQFTKLDAVVLGISPDTVERHGKFYLKYNLRHVLLSDPGHEVIEAYGAWGEKNMYGKKKMGVVRSTWIVAPDGTLAWHWPKVKAEGHAKQVEEKLRELRAG
jgi:peroxiredoxin Q/BCP